MVVDQYFRGLRGGKGVGHAFGPVEGVEVETNYEIAVPEPFRSFLRGFVIDKP